MTEEKDYRLRFFEWVKLIGKDAAIKVHKHFGGQTIYIPKLKSLMRDDRNRLIRSEYVKYGEGCLGRLAMEHDLSVVMIKKILLKVEK